MSDSFKEAFCKFVFIGVEILFWQIFIRIRDVNYRKYIKNRAKLNSNYDHSSLVNLTEFFIPKNQLLYKTFRKTLNLFIFSSFIWNNKHTNIFLLFFYYDCRQINKMIGNFFLAQIPSSS